MNIINEKLVNAKLDDESEQRYRIFFQNMQEGFVLYRIVLGENHKPVDFTIADINLSCLKMLNLKYEDAINKSVKETFEKPKLTNPNYLNLFIECVVSNKPMRRDIEVKGGMVWYDVSCFPLDNMYLYVMINDITEKKNAEIEIQRLYRAIEQSSSAIMTADWEGFIEYVNPAFEKITGYSKAEIQGHNPDILLSEMSSKHYHDLQNTIASGQEWRGEILNKKKDGTYYWTISSISPISNANGEIISFIAIQEDISELKSLHQGLEDKNKQVIEMLDDLKKTQSQLIQNEKLAGIGQLAAGVAHEINNPLGSVISNLSTFKRYIKKYEETLSIYANFLEELKEKAPSVTVLSKEVEKNVLGNSLDYIMADMVDLFTDVDEGLERIKGIVQGLRNFSRVDSLEDVEEYDLNVGVDATLLIAANEIKYFATIDKQLNEIPYIQANGGHINQVILNMVVNAVQAIKCKESEGLGNIKIITNSDDKYVYCIIEDNGIGMSKDIQSHLFEPFFTTKKVGEGTGLGLSISYDIIVNKHGGEIIVDSVQNEGSTFTIKIPINIDNK